MALGESAGLDLQTGNNNLFLGYSAGLGGTPYTSATGNVAVGANSGDLLSNGASDNTFLGYLSAHTSSSANANTTGSGNTYLGYESGAGVASADSLQNTTAVGAKTTVNSNDTIALGCSTSVNGCSANGSVVSIGSQGYGTLSANTTLNALNVASAAYSVGTISTSGSSTTVTGAGTTFTSAMVGGTIYFVDSGGIYRNEYISAVASGTSLPIGTARTISASTHYVIVYGGNRTSITGAEILQNTTDSTTAFQIQKTNEDVLFRADTTNNRLIVGNATASSGADTTLFVVDSSSTANLPSGTNGGLVYDSSVDRLKLFEGGSYATVCTATNLACSGGTTDLQGAYNNSSSPATITTTSGSKSVIVAAGSTFDQSTALFQVRNSGGTPILNVDSLNNQGKRTWRK